MHKNMANSVIVLDSSDEEADSVLPKTTRTKRLKSNKSEISLIEGLDNSQSLNAKIVSGVLSVVPIKSPPSASHDNTRSLLKRTLQQPPDSPGCVKAVKRIKPTKISDEVSFNLKKIEQFAKEGHRISLSLEDKEAESNSSTCPSTTIAEPEVVLVDGEEATGEIKKKREKTPINEAFATLLSACRKADQSTDMEYLITKKLIKYYETVHPDFVNSKSFSKTALSVSSEIEANPSLVYLKLSGILEELNIRRKSGQTVIANEDVTTTGDAKKDSQIKRLNHALYVLKKRITKLDESDVNFDDDDNSTYLLVERYKKRACEIYEKICDITGESKHAHRTVRKPIIFQGTNYPEFNKTIQTFVNRTKTFPDLFDVLRCLEHCNKQYEFKLGREEIKRIAQDAFVKIGKSLQKRRKNDLYETVSYFTGTNPDPAVEDTNLQSKLQDNQKYHSRINEIIDKYAAEQDKSIVETKKVSANEAQKQTDENENNKENEITNGHVDDELGHGCEVAVVENVLNDSSEHVEHIDDDDDDDDDEDEDEDAESEEENEVVSSSVSTINNIIIDEEIVISEDEELILPS